MYMYKNNNNAKIEMPNYVLKCVEEISRNAKIELPMYKNMLKM